MTAFKQQLAQDDIIIDIKFRMEKIKERLRPQINAAKVQLESMKDAMAKTRKAGKRMVLFDGKRMGFKKFNNLIREQSQHLQNLQVQQRVALQPLQKNLAVAQKRSSKLGQEIKRTAGQFPGWAMSIMFLGMQLQRVFTSIWQSGREAFQEVMRSTEGTVTGFDMLEGSVKYLSFTVGDALEPLAHLLIPIIDKITELVQENEKVVRTITAIGAVAGTVFATGGMAVLSINGFAGAIRNIVSAGNFVNDFNWAGLGSKIQKGIGIMSIFWAVKRADGAFKDFTSGDTVNGIVRSLSSMATMVGGLKFIKGGSPKLAGALLVAGFALELFAEDRLFKDIGGVLGTIQGLFTALMNELNNILARSAIGKFLGFRETGFSFTETVRFVRDDFVKTGSKMDDWFREVKSGPTEYDYGGYTPVDLDINVYQQPGEDNDDLVKRIYEEAERNMN